MTDRRIICLIDMDCFYVQCEQRLQPDKWGKPCGVAQYNQFRGGGLIAVNYEARPFGIKRGMRTDDCRKLCPDFHTFHVPDRNGKANLDRYREASNEVFDCIVEFIKELETDVEKRNLIVLEKASVDEGYIDFTKFLDEKPLSLPGLEDLCAVNCKVKTPSSDLELWYNSVIENFDESLVRLIMGAYYVGMMRTKIHEKTQFRCSAGISVNKMLAKLACSVNKPNAQTILPFSSVPFFFSTMDITDVRNLGGKTGHTIKESFRIRTMSELAAMDESTLRHVFDNKTAHWLVLTAKGYDDEVVVPKRLSKSIGCGKQFPGKQALSSIIQIQDWTKILCEELCDRLENDLKANERFAKQLIISYSSEKKAQSTKSMPLKLINGKQYPNAMRLSTEIFRFVFQEIKQIEPITNLAIAASKFVDATPQNSTIESFFAKTIPANESSVIGPSQPKKPFIPQPSTSKVEDELEVVEVPKEVVPVPNIDPKHYEEVKKSFFFRKIQQLYEQGKLSFLDD